MPPSSSPSPARPGPPCTRCGSGEPCPVDSAAESWSSTSTRPCHGATPRTRSRTTCGSAETTEPDQAAPAPGGELDGMRGVPVPQDGADRAEHLDVVRFVAAGILGPQQHRRQERAALRVGADDVEMVGIADHHVRGAGQFGQVLPDVVALRQPDQRAHGDAVRGGVADPHLVRDPGLHGVDDVRHQGVRDQRAADGGAFLPGLGRHLGDQLPDVQVELRGPRRDIDAEDGEVQRVRLGAEPHPVFHHRAVRCAAARRSTRTR